MFSLFRLWYIINPQSCRECYLLPTVLISITNSVKCNGKAIPLQALTDPEGFRRLRLPDFKTIGT
jgi:hypothetical protein